MKQYPNRHDDATFEFAFAEFWPKLWKYLKTQPDISDNTEEDWKESAHKVLHNNFEEDGYRLAKDFEDENWGVDADFVEVADEWSTCLYHGHTKARKAWVVSEGIKPKLAVGAKVKVKVETTVLVGEITDIRDDVGEYTVFCEAAGHKRPSEVKSGMAVTGVYIPFADLERINEVQHA